MEIKDVYNPTNSDILTWVSEGTDKWPASDWDYYVMNGSNDELVFDLANDLDCPKRDFFIHTLYYLVGSYFNESIKGENKKIRIFNLLDKVNNDTSIEVIRWKEETLDLFHQKITFNPYYWLNYMFQ